MSRFDSFGEISFHEHVPEIITMTKKKPKSTDGRIYSLDISNENLFQLNSSKSFEIDQAEKTEYGKNT